MTLFYFLLSRNVLMSSTLWLTTLAVSQEDTTPQKSNHMKMGSGTASMMDVLKV